MKNRLKKESVWYYPRPAVCQVFNGAISVKHGALILADTNQCFRTIETSHPPTYYIPVTDVDMTKLELNDRRSFCEWKGVASYYDFNFEDIFIENIAWTYPLPSESFLTIKNHLGFYASKVDACYVNGEKAQAQSGDFYGGWITSNILGPFKGDPGTHGW